MERERERARERKREKEGIESEEGKSSKGESQTNREGGAERMSEAFINMMFVISDRLPQQMFLCVL